MVGSSEKAAMARLLGIMNGTAVSETPETKTKPDEVSAMKTILEQFRRGTNEAASSLVDESRSDRSLRDAMMTEATDDGVMIGDWLITAKTGSGRKLYDVTKIGEDTPFASDLTIYEAARGLASALNDHLPITSGFVRELLRVEEDYANALHDAIHAKSVLRKQTLTESKRAILEDKYSAATRRAANARGLVLSLVKKYPYV